MIHFYGYNQKKIIKVFLFKKKPRYVFKTQNKDVWKDFL
jgi:hypothetical protein